MQGYKGYDALVKKKKDGVNVQKVNPNDSKRIRPIPIDYSRLSEPELIHLAETGMDPRECAECRWQTEGAFVSYDDESVGSRISSARNTYLFNPAGNPMDPFEIADATGIPFKTVHRKLQAILTELRENRGWL